MRLISPRPALGFLDRVDLRTWLVAGKFVNSHIRIESPASEILPRLRLGPTRPT
jgi:hypothetical protein